LPERGIPVPSVGYSYGRVADAELGASDDRDLVHLSAAQLESAARRALLLRANWSAKSPQRTRTTLIDPAFAEQFNSSNPSYASPNGDPHVEPRPPSHGTRTRVLHTHSATFLPSFRGRYLLVANLIVQEAAAPDEAAQISRVRMWSFEVWDLDVPQVSFNGLGVGGARSAECVARLRISGVPGFAVNVVRGRAALAVARAEPEKTCA
jgi:hypothetical protein